MAQRRGTSSRHSVLASWTGILMPSFPPPTSTTIPAPTAAPWLSAIRVTWLTLCNPKRQLCQSQNTIQGRPFPESGPRSCHGANFVASYSFHWKPSVPVEAWPTTDDAPPHVDAATSTSPPPLPVQAEAPARHAEARVVRPDPAFANMPLPDSEYDRR